MDELKKYLNGLGACDLKGEVDSLESAIRMMFTPQGREFCIKTGFPTLDFLRRHKGELISSRAMLIDTIAKTIDEHEICAAGDSVVEFHADKPDAIYKAIVMHGAIINIHASGYAVITATEIGGKINIINDGTAKVIIEK